MVSVLPEPDAAIVGALAADLADAAYSTDRLRELWGDAADGALGRGHRLPAERAIAATEGSEAATLATVARLFGLGAACDRDRVEQAFARTGIRGLEAAGLVAVSADRVDPRVLIRPQSFADDNGDVEWWIASDLDEAALGGPLPEDHVLGVGGASLTLAALQPTSAAGVTLDLGAGCGIQALRARRASDRVVATDISESALRFTRLNAMLNSVDGIETRRGDLFEPVAGEVFDRVVSNPPFVITPRADGLPSYEYRDGGREGDLLVEAVVRGVGAHLAEGGVAVSLGNWEYHDGSDGLERVRGWIDDTGLDAWVIEREQLDPVAYAELWIRDGGTTPGSAEFDAMLGAWLDDFERRGVRAVGFGYLLLRRPVGGARAAGGSDGAARLARYERIAQPVADGTIGPHLTQVLAAHDTIAALSDDELADVAFVMADDVTEARHQRPGDEHPTVIELRQGGGFGRTLVVDPGLAAFVGASDGDLPAGILIDAIAQLLEVDGAALRAELLPMARELVLTGFLRPLPTTD